MTRPRSAMDQAVTVDRPTLTRCTGSTPWLRAHRRNDRGLMPMKLAASVVVRVVRIVLTAVAEPVPVGTVVAHRVGAAEREVRVGRADAALGAR